MLVDMDEKASFFYPSFPICFVPESKSMIVIIHNPGWYSGIFEKNKMLESSASNDFSTYFSLNDCFLSDLDIIQRSFYEARYDYRMVRSFVPIQAIV